MLDPCSVSPSPLPSLSSLAQQITAKQAEVADYERIFNAYWGRWRDLGWRHLQALRTELADLLAQQAILAERQAP